MSTSAAYPRDVDRHAGYNKTRLFLVSCLALTMAGINAIAPRRTRRRDLQRIFLEPIDKVHSGEMIGNMLGVPFLGFAITIAIGSPLLDYIGMGLLLPLSGILFSTGMLIMMFAGNLASGAGVYNILWLGAAVAGVGWGLVEDLHQSADRDALSRQQNRQAEHAARVVAGRAGHRRPAGRRDVEHRSGLAGQAGRGAAARHRGDSALRWASNFRPPNARPREFPRSRCSASF